MDKLNCNTENRREGLTNSTRGASPAPSTAKQKNSKNASPSHRDKSKTSKSEPAASKDKSKSEPAASKDKSKSEPAASKDRSKGETAASKEKLGGSKDELSVPKEKKKRTASEGSSREDGTNYKMLGAVVVGGLIGGPVGLLSGAVQLGAASALGGGIMGYCSGMMVEEHLDRLAVRQEIKNHQSNITYWENTDFNLSNPPRPMRRNSLNLTLGGGGSRPRTRLNSLEAFIQTRRRNSPQQSVTLEAGEVKAKRRESFEEVVKRTKSLSRKKFTRSNLVPPERGRSQSIEVLFNYRTKL